jgi:hypothetical protein
MVDKRDMNKELKTETTAANKFNIGDKILWKGSPAIVSEIHPEMPWAFYVIECDNGQHILEFADQSFCKLIEAVK